MRQYVIKDSNTGYYIHEKKDYKKKNVNPEILQMMKMEN